MKQSLNLAIATDTILYAPFYLSYFPNDKSDFTDTPFGRVDVRIIGLDDDRFKLDKKLKGDGFVALSILFGYADVGIGDPSMAIDLFMRPENYYQEIKNFLSLLNDEEATSLKTRYPNIFQETPDKNAIKKLFTDRGIKIIGSLVSKIAFMVISNESLKPHDYKYPYHYVGAAHFGESIDTQAYNITKIRCYSYPSTGYYIGNIIYDGLKRADPTKKRSIDDHTDFGKELNNIGDYEIAITCDFVSVNYRLRDKKIIILDDYIDDDNSATFTGIIAATNSENKLDSLRAFLYAIDKNLHEISEFLRVGNKFDLKMLFINKLQDNPTTRKLLIADEEIEKMPNIKFTELINLFIDQLFKWRVVSNEKLERSLYYTQITPMPQDLLTMYNVRLKESQQSLKTGNKDEIKNSIDEIKKFTSDILIKWRKKESIISKHRNKWWWKLIKDEKILYYLAAIIAMVGIIGTLADLFNLKLNYGSIPESYILVGMASLILISAIFIRYSFYQKFERYVFRENDWKGNK